MPGITQSRPFRTVESLCLMLGVLLTGFFALQLIRAETDRRTGIATFQAMVPPTTSQAATTTTHTVAAPDTRLWAPARIAAYQRSLEAELPPLLGLLQIPAVHLEVPVYASDSEMSLNRGAASIDGMAYPHEPGNIGIAGHRDGYFRALKDVRVGHSLTLQTLRGTRVFTVTSTAVVESDDTRLLEDTREPTLTLVTCHPFYFVGDAPHRFIVTARPDTH